MVSIGTQVQAFVLCELGAVIVGIGMAMVYLPFAAVISDVTHPA